mmetsp:Transcript_8919/g.15701  ORF Transcript_8919/g.15701 Transcript_8919/m.15701 type:complete len:269 (+) Transcript_8919:126-932(+)
MSNLQVAPAPKAQDMSPDADDEMVDVKEGSSTLANSMAVLCLPLTLLNGWAYLDPREEAISMHFGQLTGKYDKPGCFFVNPWGLELKKLSTAQIASSLDTVKITDKRGNPLRVSAIITYRFVDVAKALLYVNQPRNYVETQAQTVLKEVVSTFTYEELKTETAAITDRMIEKLQPRCVVAGAHIQAVSLNELVYANEIAGAMLQQQKARALVEARHLLVQGAVEISNSAVEKLAENGVDMPDKEKSRLVSNLVLVTAGDTEATPVLQM